VLVAWLLLLLLRLELALAMVIGRSKLLPDLFRRRDLRAVCALSD
jgi:hypothetical protein